MNCKYVDGKPTRPFNTMQTEYHQSYRDAFKDVQTKEELDRLAQKCCNNCIFKQRRTCGLIPCKFENDYQWFRDIIEDVRAPKVIYKNNEPKREYKIKPKTQCKRTVKAYITRMSKKASVEDQAVMISIQEHINGERFKRALNLAKKHNFNTIVETINDYIGASAAK